MKLKRILSLALSGVLAISMLTACGGGSSISNLLSNRTATVRGALNSEQTMLSYKSNDSKLAEAVSKVAETITPAQIANGAVDGSVATTVQQLTGYGDMSLGSAWTAQTKEGSETYVKVFIYNVNDENYDSTAEVVEHMATDLGTMKLKADEATKGTGVTNSYAGSVAAYEKTVGEGDKAVTVWVIGVAVTQTVTKA